MVKFQHPASPSCPSPVAEQMWDPINPTISEICQVAAERERPCIRFLSRSWNASLLFSDIVMIGHWHPLVTGSPEHPWRDELLQDHSTKFWMVPYTRMGEGVRGMGR